jgi:hypothetical protein
MAARKPSFDITDHIAGPFSPAPTYSSRLDSEDYISPQTTASFPFRNQEPVYTWEDEKPYRPVSDQKKSPDRFPDEKHMYQESDKYEIQEEPYDRSHPHYIAPIPGPPPFVPSLASLPPRRRRLPPLRLLIPWTLALVFFLITLWFTSILVGVRFFNILHPSSSPINIQINGVDIPTASPSPPSSPFSAPLRPTPVSTAAATITPKPTSSSVVHEPDFDTDEGSNTVTEKREGLPEAIISLVGRLSSIVDAQEPKSTFITVTRRPI